MLVWQFVAVVLVFGLVVFVHELGHFLAAKWAGVYAPRFSIGFGRPLWKRQWGETEYIIAAIPLGGYVRMASREDATMAMIEGGGERAAPVPPDRLFESKSLAQRLVILFAGVTMNILLGFVVLTGLALFYGRPTLATRVVGAVRPTPQAPALAERIQPGDTLLVVDGREIKSWNDVVAAIVGGSGDRVRVRTQRGEVEVALAGAPDSARRALGAALDPFIAPVIGQVVPGRPAERARLEAGDSLIAVGGAPVRTWGDVVERIKASPGVTLPVDYVRGGARRSTVVRPDVATESDGRGGTRRIGQVGVLSRLPEGREPVTPGAAVATGWRETWWMAGAVVGYVRDLVTRKTSVKNLGGPIAIVRESSAAARRGLESLLRLLAFLSVNVAIFNLLPIPVLDGGNIVINIVEAVRGSALSDRTREYVMRFGLAAIALLFVVVMFNDLKHLVERLLGS